MNEPSPSPLADGPGLWPLITCPGIPLSEQQAETLRPVLERFSKRIKPPLTVHLLGENAAVFGYDDLSPQEVEKHLLGHRFLRHKRLQWADFIAAKGIETVVLKGMATAHDIYPDPDLRHMSDMDLLVRRDDLGPLVTLLKAEGFKFHSGSQVPPWGLITDASFPPLISREGDVNIDIHIHPDDYPVHRSLSTAAVFADSRVIEAGTTRLRIPSRTHLMLLAITNAGRDKSEKLCLKGLIDALLFIENFASDIDWDEIETLATEGGFLKPLGCFLALVTRLGVPPDHLPQHLIPHYRGFPAAGEFERLIGDFETMFETPPSMLTRLRRETLLTAEWRTIWLDLWKNARPDSSPGSS